MIAFQVHKFSLPVMIFQGLENLKKGLVSKGLPFIQINSLTLLLQLQMFHFLNQQNDISKQLTDFSVMSKSLNFLSKVHNEKLHLYQKFYSDIVPTAPSFIKNKTPTCVFFLDFQKTFQPATFLKATLAQFFSYEFAKYLKTLPLQINCESLLI